MIARLKPGDAPFEIDIHGTTLRGRKIRILALREFSVAH
jgi:hypothetical protein